MARRLIALVGPTAAGKSALGLELARDHGGEIVSCDSLQVYRGFDIGSAKPTAEERRRVPHHLVDVAEPDAVFSAADYARLGRGALDEIAGRGRLPIVVGGTGLYLRALVGGLFEGPARDEPLRRRLEASAGRRGGEHLHRMLARVDPGAAARIHTRDRVRIVRALEVYFTTGRPLTEHHRAALEPLAGWRLATIGLAPERERLRERVVQRTGVMLEQGLIEEVRGLVARHGRDLRPLQAIGYRQALAVVEGRAGVDEARRDIVTETMRYAKRQMTWFRHQAEVSWHAEAGAARDAAERWLAEAP